MAWTARTVSTWMSGASNLRMNLLVGGEATHCLNVPKVVKKESEEHFPLSHDNTTDHDINLNIFPEGLKKSEIDKEQVISDLQETNASNLYENSDISEPQRTIPAPYCGSQMNSEFGNRAIIELFLVKNCPSNCYHSINSSRTHSKKITKERNLR